MLEHRKEAKKGELPRSGVQRFTYGGAGERRVVLKVTRSARIDGGSHSRTG
jgi:hypothetical protein